MSGYNVATDPTWADEALCRSLAHLPAIGAGTPTDETNIPQIVAAAAEAVEEAVDATVTVQSFTEFYSGGNPTIALLHGPIVSVDSVAEFVGVQAYPLAIVTDLALANNAYCASVNTEFNFIERRIFGGMSACFFPGRDNVQVTYQAGMTTVPKALQIGTALLFKYLWDATMPTSNKQRVVAQEIALGALASEGLPSPVLAALKAYLPGPVAC